MTRSPRKVSVVSSASDSTQDTESSFPIPQGADDTSDSKYGNLFSSQSSDAGGYSRIGIFTVNIIAGIIGSQLASGMMPHDVYHVWYEVVSSLSLLCLAFIMINVGYEFNLDKSNLHLYGTDTLVAMTAAGFPWIFVACWFIWALPNPLPWDQALVAARFAAPTSAGVLFCMLEAAGLKETWLFKKARILAIFDDLDTILFMVPLKAILVGLKWELFLILFVVVGLLVVGYKRLHAYHLPTGWRWTMIYALAITVVTEVVYYMTHHHIAMEAIHIEVLLPAFILGVIIQIEEHAEDHNAEQQPDAACNLGSQLPPVPPEAKRVWDASSKEAKHQQEERVLTFISALFMVFVGLSMPPLFGGDSMEGNNEPISAGEFVGHVVAVSVLMVLGKMFPLACYQKEANLRTRFALAMGMCPRGEVGAGVILISLDLGIKGDAIGIAVVCLALNMVMTGGFIVTVKRLVSSECFDQGPRGEVRRIHRLASCHEIPGLDPVIPGTPSLGKDVDNSIQRHDIEGHQKFGMSARSASKDPAPHVLSINPPQGPPGFVNSPRGCDNV